MKLRPVLGVIDQHTCELTPERAAKELAALMDICEGASWANHAEVRSTYPSADLVGSCYVFNIKGNRYRLIAKIDFGNQVFGVREVMTHEKYQRGGYEKRHFRDTSPPADRLSELVASRGMKPSDIRHVFGSGNVYDVIKGKRAAKELAAIFSVPAELFI
jgi:mRNA interferase HigB